MKTLFAICMFAAAIMACAADQPAPAGSIVKGKVLEIRNVESYTYLRLKTKDGETWAAVGRAPVKDGAEVTIDHAMVMNNFTSKSLQKTFPTIVFGNLVGAGNDMQSAHAAAVKTPDAGDARVAKAKGANARTVAETVTGGADLKDKPVLVRGRIVKYNPAIMDKNWIHLRDGTGSAADDTNDILVTTLEPAKVGDIVTVKGIVRTNKDYGAGYAYKVVIEEATLQK